MRKMLRPRPLVSGILLVAVAIALPFIVSDPYWQHLIDLTIIFGILALSLDVILGDMGQFSFGHQAFFGVGAYVTALLTVDCGFPPWAGAILGIAASALLGLVIGAVALRRARGLHLAIITLGTGKVVEIIATNWYDLTGGISGIPMIPPLNIWIPHYGWTDLDDEFSFYFLAIVLLALTIFILWVWRRSKSGHAVAAIRDNEQLARAVGISPYKYYLQAFVLASALAGLAGVAYAHFNGQIAPQSLGLYYMFWLLVMVIVGGMRTIPGPIIGAAIFVLVPELLEGLNEFRMIVFGALLLVIIVFAPSGIYPLLRRLALWAFTLGRRPIVVRPATPQLDRRP